MRYFLSLLVVLVGVLALVGCSGPDDVQESDAGADAVEEEELDEGADAVEEEEPDAGADAVEEEDIIEEEVCEPVIECTADQCGEQDDGCGATIDCGVCDCVDGVSQIDSCGVCDLGVVVCGEAQTGAATCEEREIPGVSACSELVFVDQVEGSDLGTGTKDAPVATLADGFDVAKNSGALAVLVAGDDSVTYAGPILLEERISLMGGYDSEWVYQEDHLPVLESDAGVDGMVAGDIVGIALQGVSEEMVIANFEVSTGDVTAAGGSNYGVYMMDSSGVTLKNMDVYAGRGGDGVDGEGGTQGASGENGGNAKSPITSWPSTFAGAGGVNEECPEANGGDGGMGGLYGDIPPEDGVDAEGGALGWGQWR